MARYQLRDFVKSSFILLAAQALLKLINFFLLPLYTSYLDPSMLGTVDTINNFSGFLYPLLVLGMDAAFGAFYFENDEIDFRSAIFANTRMTLQLTSLVSIAFMMASPYLSQLLFNNRSSSLLITVSLATIVSNLWSLPMLLELRMKNRMLLYGCLQLVVSFITIILNIVFIRFMQLGTFSLLGSAFVGSVIQLAVLWILRSLHGTRDRWNPEILKRMLRFSLPLVPTGLMSWVLNVSDRAILLHYLGTEEVGIYGIAARLSSLSNLVISAINTAYTPFAYSNMENRNNTQFRNILHAVTLFLTLISVISALFAKEVVQFMTNSAYANAAWVIRDLMFSQVFYFMYCIVCYGINYHRKTKYIFYITMTSAIVNVILNILLIPSGGAAAAALTTLISMICMFGLGFVLSKRLYPYPYQIVPLLIFISFSYMLSVTLCSESVPNKLLISLFLVLGLGLWKYQELKTVLTCWRKE